MKEIEIKIQLPEDDYKKLETWLKQEAEFKGQKHHVEYYFDNPNQSFKFTSPQGYIDAANYFRVRMTEKGDSICLKKFYIDPETDKSINLGEYETEVGDGQKMIKLLQELGFTDHIIIDKTRRSYLYQKFEIVIDDVKDLGKFVEIEILEHDDDVAAGVQEIYNFLRSIAITKFIKHTRGYVSMIWNRNYNFGQEKDLNK